MKPISKWLAVLAAIQVVLPFLLQSQYYEPHRDEFLYLAESSHLAWGYMEAPPLLSLFGWMASYCGGGLFWIKIWPALFGAFTFVLVGKMVIQLGGKTLALILCWLPFILDAYLRLFFLFQPNFLEVFFYTAIAFCWFQWMKTEKPQWIYLSGIAVGLGVLSKASVVFYAVGILAGILITQQRKIFKIKHIYLAAFIAGLIILPHFIWQYQHQFPFIHHMQLLHQSQLQYVSSQDFLKGQLLLNLPCFYIWIIGLIWVLLSTAGKKYRLFGWAYITVIVLLLLLHGKDYYALGLYPLFFGFGAYAIEQFTQTHHRWLLYPVISFSIILGIFAWPVLLPIATPKQLAVYYTRTHLNQTDLFKWEDQQMHPLPQDFADMIGWKSTTAKLSNFYNHLPETEKNNTLIFSRNYAFAGAMNYYGKQYHLPEVFSDDASFVLWMPNHYHIQNIILIAKHLPNKNDTAFHMFERYTVIDSLNNPLARENGTKIIYFQNAQPHFNQWLNKRVAALKAPYYRNALQ
ncbi:MAG: glycosyltransferase family 39 protein [Bacteroidota bacterium]|nr:glycosyltransferase family 39 protein [Bacteroidota bacterium]